MAFFASFAQSRRIPVAALDPAVVDIEEAIVDTFTDYKTVEYEDREKDTQRTKIWEFHELPKTLSLLNAQSRAFNLSQRIEFLRQELLERLQDKYLSDPIAQKSDQQFIQRSKKLIEDSEVKKLIQARLEFRIELLPKIEKFVRKHQKKLDAICRMEKGVYEKQITKVPKVISDIIIQDMVELNKRLKELPEAPVHDLLKTPFSSIGDDKL